MHQKAFGGRAPSGPAGERLSSRRPSSRNMGPTSKGRGSGGGGDGGREGRKGGRGGKEGEGEEGKKGRAFPHLFF